MLYDPRRLHQPDPCLFDPAWYGTQATPVDAGGRQSAWFVQGDFGHGVLRHYRRGGLAARLSRRHYIWLGESRTRSFMEFRLLESLGAQGLAVPPPLAAAYWRSGLSYECAILVERLPDVRPLALMLDDAGVPLVSAVAAALARMHEAGVWHADLNAYNILVDARGHAWIIDFDRGRQRGVSARARANNMRRLRRSLEKVGGARGLALHDRLEAAYRQCLRR
jgi:3-deoxy-D-manno-octulosonic acid kinase